MMLSESKKLSRRLDSCKPPPLSYRSSAMASIQEILESMRPDFQKLNALISNAIETNRALVTDMRESSRESKEILNSFELLIKEIGSEGVAMENGIAKVELQSESGHATDAESSHLVDSKECSEKVLILKNHSVSNSHHSPFSRHRSDRTLDRRNTWVQRQKFKNHQLCVCQWKPHVICHFRTWDEGTIKVWHPGDLAIFIRSVWICKATLTGIWDPGGIILNVTVSWGEKARKCREATSPPTVRSIVKVSEPLVGMGNTKGNDGLKPWCNSKRQIQDSCSSKAVKYSRFEVADMGSRTKNDATAKYIRTLTYHQLGCIFSDSHHDRVAFFESIVVVTCLIKEFAGCFCKFWWFRRLSNNLMLGIFLKFRTHIGSVPAVFCFRILFFLQVLDTQYMDVVRHGCYRWGLIYVFGELGLLDCSRVMFGKMSGPYLATDITVLHATAESLLLLVVVYIHISVKFHLILNFFSTICSIMVNGKCPDQSFMQFLVQQHYSLRAAFEQFNVAFFAGHYTHISLNEVSKVAAPRKKIVPINDIRVVEAKDKIEIAEFESQLPDYEEVIVAMLGGAVNVNHCFKNGLPNHSVGRILEQQIGISSLAKNNGIKMCEDPLANDHTNLPGRFTWAARVGSCLYISCFFKFWDPGGFGFELRLLHKSYRDVEKTLF